MNSLSRWNTGSSRTWSTRSVSPPINVVRTPPVSPRSAPSGSCLNVTAMLTPVPLPFSRRSAPEGRVVRPVGLAGGGRRAGRPCAGTTAPPPGGGDGCRSTRFLEGQAVRAGCRQRVLEERGDLARPHVAHVGSPVPADRRAVPVLPQSMCMRGIREAIAPSREDEAALVWHLRRESQGRHRDEHRFCWAADHVVLDRSGPDVRRAELVEQRRKVHHRDAGHDRVDPVLDSRQERDHVGAESVSLYGVSLGAYVVSLLAGIEDGINSVVGGLPVVDLPALFHELSPAHVRARSIEHNVIGGPAETVFVPVSPLRFAPKVPHEGRFIFAGRGDRLANPAHAHRLWEHWDRPPISWYWGSHVGYLWSRQVATFLEDSLATTRPHRLSLQEAG